MQKFHFIMNYCVVSLSYLFSKLYYFSFIKSDFFISRPVVINLLVNKTKKQK